MAIWSIALLVSTNSIAILLLELALPPSNLNVSNIINPTLFFNFSLFIIAHMLSLLKVGTERNLNFLSNFSEINLLAFIKTFFSSSVN